MKMRAFRVVVVTICNYASLTLLLSVEESTHYFLKTIIPSRKATRDYLGTEGTDEKA